MLICAPLCVELLRGSLICYTHCDSGLILDFVRIPSGPQPARPRLLILGSGGPAGLPRPHS